MPEDESRETRPRPSVPVPDPTLLTTQQLIREIKALQEIIDAKLAGMDRATSSLEILINEKIGCISNQSNERHKGVQLQFHERDTRFDQALNAAMQVAQATAKTIEEKNAHLQELHGEKFASVEKQFEQRDVALLSTLNATKETFREQQNAAAVAIAKSEAGTVKAIDQLQVLLQTATDAIESKISDLKERVGRMENVKVGQVEQRAETQGSQIQWVGILGLVLGGIVALGGVLVAVSSGGPVVPLPERVVIEQVPGAGGTSPLR